MTYDWPTSKKTFAAPAAALIFQDSVIVCLFLGLVRFFKSNPCEDYCNTHGFHQIQITPPAPIVHVNLYTPSNIRNYRRVFTNSRSKTRAFLKIILQN